MVLSLIRDQWNSRRLDRIPVAPACDASPSLSLRVVTARGLVSGCNTADIVVCGTNTGPAPLELVSACISSSDPLSTVCCVPCTVSCLETYLFPLLLQPLEDFYFTFSIDPSLTATTYPTPDPVQQPDIQRAFATHVVPLQTGRYPTYSTRIGERGQGSSVADQLDAQLRVGPSWQSVRGLTILQSLQRLRVFVTINSPGSQPKRASRLFSTDLEDIPPQILRIKSIPVSIGSQDFELQSAPLQLVSFPQRYSSEGSNGESGTKENPLFNAQIHAEGNLPELELFTQTALEVQVVNTLSTNQRIALVANETPDASVIILTPKLISPNLGPGEPFIFTIAVMGTRKSQNALLQTLATCTADGTQDDLGEAQYELSGIRFIVR